MKAPTRKGYTFRYWKGSKYKPGDKYLVKEDHTLTAVWKKGENPNGPSDNGGADTGDNSHILLAIKLMTLSLIGLTATALSRRRV